MAAFGSDQRHQASLAKSVRRYVSAIPKLPPNAASGGSIVNQVLDIYNGLDQLVQEYHSHSGAVVTGTTPSVQYAYTEMSGGQNNSRLVSMTYPDGRVIDYNYNAGLDSSISRLSSISDSTGTLESYLYLGLDTVVERDHPQTGVNETYISQNGSTGDAGDQYTGLDRFGRVVEVNWYDTNTDTSTDDFQYGYDPDGNVLYVDNMLDSSDSELFTYDNLNQLTTFERGTLSASPPGGQLNTIASPSETESWTLDALGNFTAVTVNGTQTDATFNQQNEETTDGSASLTYDKNGNTLTDAQGNVYTYNAWNQLVSVSNGGTTIAAYTVDGLGRRITENESGTLTDVYFSSQWQVLEEDVAGSMTNQYVWSPVYVNAMIERDTPTQRLYVQQDANWNVTALVNTSGAAVERYLYDPYGAVTYLTANWSTESGSQYGWHYLFQGGRLDTATGLYDFQHRDESPDLGRWTQVDPRGFCAGNLNLYLMVNLNPAGLRDPAGLQPGPPPTEHDFHEIYHGFGVYGTSPGIPPYPNPGAPPYQNLRPPFGRWSAIVPPIGFGYQHTFGWRPPRQMAPPIGTPPYPGPPGVWLGPPQPSNGPPFPGPPGVWLGPPQPANGPPGNGGPSPIPPPGSLIPPRRPYGNFQLPWPYPGPPPP